MHLVPLLVFLHSVLALTRAGSLWPWQGYIQFFEVSSKVTVRCDASNNACTTSIKFKSLSDSDRNWETPPLIARYRKTFGPWTCDFLVQQPHEPRVCFLTLCMTTDSKISVDGVFAGSIYSHFLYYDNEDERQRLMSSKYHSKVDTIRFRSLVSKRLLSGDDEVLDPESESGDEDGDEEQLGWVTSEEEEFNSIATIEVGIFLDKYYMDHFDHNVDEATKYAHSLINGATAIMSRSGHKVEVAFIRVLDMRENSKINGTFNELHENLSYKDMIREMFEESDMIYALEGQRIGRPDVTITLTERFKLGESTHLGWANLNSICRDADAMVTLLKPNPSEWHRTLWLSAPGPVEYLMTSVAWTVTHEIGHILGLRHLKESDKSCPEENEYGALIMRTFHGYPSLMHGTCYEQVLRDFAAYQFRSHGCLFRKDVFAPSDRFMIRPRVMYVKMPYKSHGKDIPYDKGNIYFDMHPFHSAPINLRAAFDFWPLVEENGCTMYHSWHKESFAAFENCRWAYRRWKGFYHMSDRRVMIEPVVRNGTWVHRATFSALLSANGSVPNVTNPLLGEVRVNLIVGIEDEFSNSYSGHWAAINRTVIAVNMVDALFRQMRIRVYIHKVVSVNTNRSMIEQAQRFYKSENLTQTAFLIFTSAANQTSRSEPAPHCSYDNVGIVRDIKDDYKFGAETAHVLGHLLGLTDDEGKCGCRTKLGTCIMHPKSGTRAFLWSECTMQQLRDHPDITCAKGRKDPEKASSGTIIFLDVFVILCTIAMSSIFIAFLVTQIRSHMAK